MNENEGLQYGASFGSQPRTFKTVLCIADDPDISRAIEMRLRPYAVTVLQAFHGMQGFWLAMTEHPDLIITDINMPQGQGDYIVECLKRNSETQSMPVVVLSGRREKAMKSLLHNLGVDRYLTKPCDSAELLETIESLIDLQTAADYAVEA